MNDLRRYATDLVRRRDVLDILQARLYQMALNSEEYRYSKICEDIAMDEIGVWINEVKPVVLEIPPNMTREKFIKNVLETLRDMDDAVDVICNLDVDAVLDQMEVDG